MSRIEEAIILAAGAGTRLREASDSKPLCRVAGRALIDHAIAGLASAGIGHIIVVTGYEADRVEAHLAATGQPVEVDVVRTPDWRGPNGVSALAARPAMTAGESLLVMADHLVDPALYRLAAEQGAGPGLRLVIDRRLEHPWIDDEDVTRVRTEGKRIRAVGKLMAQHDAYDTGVFAVGQPLFDTLAALDDPSLSEAVTLLAEQGRAETIDSGGKDWIDVDDPRALAIAEDWWRSGPALSEALGGSHGKKGEQGCA